MTIPRYTKHPSDIVAYPIDVVGLGSSTIGVVTGAVTVGDVTVSSVTASGARVTALIAGGTAGTLCQVEVTINLSNGERRIKEFEIMVTNN